jgi:hypothetical protein
MMSCFVFCPESVSQNITVNGGQSTPYDASTRRFSADPPPCGDSFVEKSPPVISRSNSVSELSKNHGHQRNSNMLQPTKDFSSLASNFTSPITSTLQSSSPASFQSQSIPDIIDIEDDEIPPYSPGPDQRKSSCGEAIPRTGDSGRSMMGMNINTDERPSNVCSRKTPAKKPGNSLPDDGYRSKRYYCTVLYCSNLY